MIRRFTHRLRRAPRFGLWIKRFLVGTALLLAGCAAVGPTGNADGNISVDVGFDKALISTIRAATFEVVVPKPVRDSLSYERPLPMNLVPYAIRKDKYYSIGTAFAIAPGKFVSAAHVLTLGNETQYQGFYLRDGRGNVYGIDRVLKYSDRRDFVVFTLKHAIAHKVLVSNSKPRVNEKVYTVGNAHGEGVVFRDGMYTSDTPEERDGDWNWIRFSAAASPGNSGGPLLDKDGKLIGIVLRKSENENLNYALPITEVLNARDNLAVMDMQMIYTIDNMDMSKTQIFKKEIRLPKPYAELNRELIAYREASGRKIMDGMFAENKANIFPNGTGSTALLHRNFSSVFPRLIAKGADGQWDAYGPSKVSDADLGQNGSLSYGAIGSGTLLRMRKPDGVPLERLYRDSKLMMDLMLKGLNFKRTVGPESVKITSLGKAHEEYTHVDAYQRKWLVKTWLVEYTDEKIVVFALPAPGGFVGMMRAAQTGQIQGHIMDMKALTDFTYMSYYGSLDQWRELLALKQHLPPALTAIDIDFEYGKTFRYKSKRLSFVYGPDLMKITRNSDLQLNFSYFQEGGKVLWDMSKAVVGEDKNSTVAYVLSRNMKPTAKMDDKFQSEWKDIVENKHPYNNTLFFDEKRSLIGAVFAGKERTGKLANAPLLYTVVYGTDGNAEQKAVEVKLSKFMQTMAVHE